MLFMYRKEGLMRFDAFYISGWHLLASKFPEKSRTSSLSNRKS